MQTRKILTIDDDEDINNYLKVVLKKHDYEIETACEIEDFFQKVIDFQPNLCLVDLNLGDYEGFGYKIIELMRKKIGPEIVIIIMSRRNSDTDITHALECGANDYIQKPIDEDILVSKLNIFLDKPTDSVNFPFYAVPSGDAECTFHVPMKIHAITEESIQIFSSDYIAKGSLLEIEGTMLDGHSFVIREVTLDRENGGYLLKIDLDEQENANIFPIIRRIMLETPPLE